MTAPRLAWRLEMLPVLTIPPVHQLALGPAIPSVQWLAQS